MITVLEVIINAPLLRKDPREPCLADFVRALALCFLRRDGWMVVVKGILATASRI